MCGSIPLLLLYAFMAWAGTSTHFHFYMRTGGRTGISMLIGMLVQFLFANLSKFGVLDLL
jgi:hypothetical protein